MWSDPVLKQLAVVTPDGRRMDKAEASSCGAATVRSCEKMRPQAGVGKLKHAPPMPANRRHVLLVPGGVDAGSYLNRGWARMAATVISGSSLWMGTWTSATR